jgi:hypothetical protein
MMTNTKKHIFTVLIVLGSLLPLYGSNTNTLRTADILQDSDFDGVSDKLDLCPNTPFDVLVNQSGCALNAKLSYAVGLNYLLDKYDYGTNEALNTQIEFYYRKDNWNISFSTASFLYYNYTDDNNETYDQHYRNVMDDSYLSFTLIYPIDIAVLFIEKLYISYKLSFKIPTAYSPIGTSQIDTAGYISLSGYKDALSYFTTLGYIYNQDSQQYNYKNEHSFNAGLGYTTRVGNYFSASYTQSTSNSYDESLIHTFTFFTNLPLSDKNALDLSYSLGYSNQARYKTINIFYLHSF